MHHETKQALDLVTKMMAWEKRGTRLDDASLKGLALDEYGTLTWATRFASGGPVRITTELRDVARIKLEDLAKEARNMIKIATEVQDHSASRADYENEIAQVAKSLLRRKNANGIRLMSVVSQPIPVDCYSDIGVELTFEINRSDRVTLEVWDTDELRKEFARVTGDEVETAKRQAA